MSGFWWRRIFSAFTKPRTQPRGLSQILLRKKNGRHSEECACRLTKKPAGRSEECTHRLDRYTYSVRDTFRQKLVVGVFLHQHFIRRWTEKTVTGTNDPQLQYHNFG